MNPQEPPQITLRLRHFLNYALGSNEWIEIEYEDAVVIQALDKDEVHCHVQMSGETDELRKPRLWWIRPWRESYTRWLKVKQESEARRREWCLLQENTERLARGMSLKLGLQKELVYAAARSIAAKKLVKAAEQFGVKLEL